MPRRGRRPGRKYGAGERANRRTRLAPGLDPGLREVLHALARAHVPLCRAERGYERPETWGECDMVRRARNGDPTILQDLVLVALGELYAARDMLRDWAGPRLDVASDGADGERTGARPGA